MNTTEAKQDLLGRFRNCGDGSSFGKAGDKYFNHGLALTARAGCSAQRGRTVPRRARHPAARSARPLHERSRCSTGPTIRTFENPCAGQ